MWARGENPAIRRVFENNGNRKIGINTRFESEGSQSEAAWLDAMINLPWPSDLSDDEMEAHFHDFDGKWSEQTKAGVAASKCVGLDLNDNWALTWKGWACPACRRAKPEIFRLSKRNILLAELELH